MTQESLNFARESQSTAILRALQDGERLTCLQILDRFQCNSGKQRIWDLKEVGWNIKNRVSFFHYQTVTPYFRTIPHTTKDGREVKIITIWDAVAWSKTSDHKGRGRAFVFDFVHDDAPSPDRFVCASTMGACE